MSDVFLTASYADREKVKALGARWNPAEKRWYVPDGRDLSPFAAWLPATPYALAASATSGLALGTTSALALDSTLDTKALANVKSGISLSALLGGVAQAVARSFSAGVWTLVEVVDTRLRNGHVYVEISERSLAGAVLAKSNAVIWANNAARILPEFERATGATLGPGIKLLVCAKPSFSSQYGFSIEIDAIDPEYTLGDLEAKKRDIRARLQADGIFDANRLLPAPWDYNAVLVIAPDGAAGLGDFQAEAERLEQAGVCAFSYATSRFQGEGAAAQITRVMQDALARFELEHGVAPDAVVIIRGGGAVNDLAWLNDYPLARAVCELGVPVLTGIGHERDNTILDEVAHQRFDTPSKVIAGIEQFIAKRSSESADFFAQISLAANRCVMTARRAAEQADAALRSGASEQLAIAKHGSAALMAELKLASVRSLQDGTEAAQSLVVEIKHAASQQLLLARHVVPARMAEVTAEGRQALRTAKAQSQAALVSLTDRAAADVRAASEDGRRAMADVGTHARQALTQSAQRSEALMREITGQGPDKTLSRGFAIVRNQAGASVTSVAALPVGALIEIQFRDGRLNAATTRTNGTNETNGAKE